MPKKGIKSNNMSNNAGVSREDVLSTYVAAYYRSTSNQPSQCPACGYIGNELQMIAHYKVCSRMKHKTEKVKADWTPPWAKK